MCISAFVHRSVNGPGTYVSLCIGGCIGMDREMGANHLIVGVTNSCYKTSLTNQLPVVDSMGPPPKAFPIRTV